MHVTSKGQITIPQNLREKYGINQNTEVEFYEENGKIYIKKRSNKKNIMKRYDRFRGIATVKMTTDEIMALTRG